MSIASISSITGNAAPTPTNAGGVAKSASSSASSAADSKSEFLKLLVTQLQNQDPLNPTDQKEMLAQLAQFSSLEQMQNLNTTMTNTNTVQQLGQGSALIGKTVSTVTGDGSAGPAGVVSSVVMKSGVAYLHIGDQDVDMSTVSTVK